MDFWAMEFLGHIDIKAEESFFCPVGLHCRDNLAQICISTKAGWLVIYDVQKEKVVNCLIGHAKELVKILRNKVTRSNFFSLGKDNLVIQWLFSVDKWVPTCFSFSPFSLLKDDKELFDEYNAYLRTTSEMQ